ncbi:MAG TPA: hypothetical protein ENK43_11805 [Planctomycetes bacterium]|nr:hypothetical protein [Planctomycetota bacterium]
MSIRLTPLLLLILAATTAGQFKQTIGVSGLTSASSSFTLRLEALPTFQRDIDFTSLPTDYPATAMAELMVNMINDDFRRNGSTGFTASDPVDTEGRGKFDATFILHCTVPITDVKVGMLGNPVTPIPRPPGVGFNPNVFDYNSTATGPGLPPPFIGTQVGLPNASLSVDGLNPDNDFLRRIQHIVGEPLELGVSSGANPTAGFFLLAGPFLHGTIQLPFTGDFLDVGIPPTAPGALPTGISILGDGIGNATGTFWDQLFVTDPSGTQTIVIGNTGGFASLRIGIQGGVADPTAVPFGFRLTQAADIDFGVGQRAVLPISSDGVVAVPFAQSTFTFYNQTYSQVFVHENGFVSMSPFGPVGASNSLVDPLSAANDAPAIFVNWADWDLSGTGGIEIFEFRDRFVVGWGTLASPIHHQGDTDLARFECTLLKNSPSGVSSPQSGGILINLLTLDPLAVGGNDALVGISPGMGMDPNPLNRDLGQNQFAAGAFGSLLQHVNRDGTALSNLSVASGGTPVYANGSTLGGRQFAFFPPGNAGPQGTQYQVVPLQKNPNDIQGVAAPATLSQSAGAGQTVVLVGSFQYLFSGTPAGVSPVTLDPAGTAGIGPLPLTVVGIMDDTGTISTQVGPTFVQPVQPGFRAFEGLVVSLSQQLPVTAPGAVLDLQVDFGDGSSFLLPGALLVTP